MKAVTYITENTIMKFLYNPKKTFLEGFVKEWLRFDSGTYQDYGKYVRFLKVAIRDNVMNKNWLENITNSELCIAS